MICVYYIHTLIVCSVGNCVWAWNKSNNRNMDLFCVQTIINYLGIWRFRWSLQGFTAFVCISTHFYVFLVAFPVPSYVSRWSAPKVSWRSSQTKRCNRCACANSLTSWDRAANGFESFESFEIQFKWRNTFDARTRSNTLEPYCESIINHRNHRNQ